MIYVSYGKEIIKNTHDLLAASDISSYLAAGCSVSIKPNLVVSRPAKEGATTHPEVVEGIIIFLKDFGVREIKIIESSWVGDSTKRAFKACGYEKLSEKYDVPLIDLKADSCTVLSYGKYSMEICDEALKTDFLINVPVLKAHGKVGLTCCLKNLKGCISDREKRNFHTLGIHKPIAALNALLATGYCVIDGICGDLSFEEGGHPVTANRLIAGRNPLLLDSYCAELIGYRPDEIEYLSYSKEIGLGDYYSQDTKIVELNKENKPIRETKGTRAADKHKHLIVEDSACSACYSALIFALHRLDGKTGASGKLHIGQGFKEKSGSGVGIGNCARGFTRCVTGCPPKAADIIDALK